MQNLFEEVFPLMEEAFPDCERRTRAHQERLLSRGEYCLNVKRDEEGRAVAFLACWSFKEFRFVEHLAVSREMRGKGIGGILLSEFLKQDDRPVILEVEPGKTPLALRRIGFYKQHGFYLNTFPYLQPPMRSGEAELPLCIMSFPSSIGAEEFLPYKKILYREVYGREL